MNSGTWILIGAICYGIGTILAYIIARPILRRINTCTTPIVMVSSTTSICEVCSREKKGE